MIFDPPEYTTTELRQLREENNKLRFWLDEEALAAGRLQRQVNKDTALLRQSLEALERADKISGYANNKKVITALRERLKA